MAAGRLYILQFDGILTLTDDADHDLGGADITTAAGDVAVFYATAANTVRLISYTKESGVFPEDLGVGTNRQILQTDASVASWADRITLATEQASTSGTSIDFTSIPSGVKRITIMFVGVSTSGTSDIIIQLGDTGGIEASGYNGTTADVSPSGTVEVNYGAGFVAVAALGAGSVEHGSIVLSLEDSAQFTWAAAGILSASSATVIDVSAGTKSLTAELDRVRITTAGGSDTFDAGAINIQYE